MSQFIQDFRAKYPQYEDVPDDQLVTSLHSKYYSDMPIDQFNQKIGFQPVVTTPQDTLPVAEGSLPQQQDLQNLPQQPDGFAGAAMKAPEEKSMLELFTEKLGNMGAGAVERAGDLGGALLGGIQTVGEGLEKSVPLGGFVWEDGDVLPSYKTPEEFAKSDAPAVLNKGSEVLKNIDLGYQEQVGWEDVKKSFSEGGPLSGSAYADVLEYGIEQGVKSIPDMVAAIYSLPAYIFARSGEIGEQRAVNKGKEKAELEDVLEAAPFAVASSLLERIGAKGMTQAAKEELGKEVLKAGIANSVKRVSAAGGKALGKEAATEAIQEGMIEYVGERYGTKAAMDWKEALDQAAAGAVAGGVYGGIGGTSSAVANEINYSPEKAIAKQLDKDVEAAEVAGTEQAVIDALSPEQAQLEQVSEQPKPEEIQLKKEKQQKKQDVNIEKTTVIDANVNKKIVSEHEAKDVDVMVSKPLVDTSVKPEVQEPKQVQPTQITEETKPESLSESARVEIKNKPKKVQALAEMEKPELVKEAKTPKPSQDKEVIAEKAVEQQIYSNVAKSSAITTFKESEPFDSQVESETKKQTKLDIEKEANNTVRQAEMSRDGKITYPQPEEDVNTREYKKRDKLAYQVPKDGERIFHAPGHNYVGLFRSTGIPDRQESVTIEGREVKIPDSPQRIEPIMRKLIQIAGRRIYFGKIKGSSNEGFYRPNVGEIRTRKKNDVEVLAHELAHYLDEYSNVKLPNFKKLYTDKKYSEEVKQLSYTDADPDIQGIEGFAEFVRLWLTNANEAQLRAPNFYKAFTDTLARDRKLLNPMRDMQDLMHKFYFQGPDKLGQALIGKDTSFIQDFEQWKYRRDSRIRQQTIDRFHAARKIEQELTGQVGTAQESAWKQFRLANGGAEGISDYIMNYGTVNFDENGDLKVTGKSLHEVLAPVKNIKLSEKHKGDKRIDLLMRYFAGRRALELHRQKRENLIPKETAKEWARLGKTYPVFESIHKEYQAFNDRMMDFYEEAGMITPEGREAMQSMNKDYVPFNRIRDQLSGGGAASSGFKKLKGGTANLNDILVNIQDGVTANVRAALNNRAKQRLYQYISSHKDGAIFATRIAPDSRKVQVYADEMKDKIGKVLEMNGIELEGDIDLATKGLLEFWQHGVAPKVNESGNIVDSVIINGKPKYYEVQDPLLQEMLLSMNPESYSSFMNVMFGVKNFFTRMITLGVEFTGANLVRDTIGATFLSKNNFIPFIDTFKGMHSFITRDKYYQDFLRSGGGNSSRLESLTKERTARKRVSIDEFGVMTIPEKLISGYDNLMSAFEYGTRIGEFRLAKKNMKSDMDAGFEAREISTDFSVLGANRFLTGYIRTVPFLNAMIQSQDRVFREAIVSKKYDGNPTALAMKAFLGITIPTLILYLVNKDDEDYQQIPDYEKRTNWHIPIGNGQFFKIPRPYDVGFVFATIPELFFKYIEDDKGKEFADGMLWTLTQMYGIDGTPAMMTGWWDLVRNKKWTGAPVVPQSLSNVEAPEQYTSNTSETFVRMGEALGISPVKAEHMFKAYTGYLGGYLLWGTDHMLWDEDKFGPKPDRKASDNIFLRRFLTPDVRPSSAAMEKFFDLKEKSDKVVATFRQQVDIRRAIAQREGDQGKFNDDRFFGLSAKEKGVLFALNDSMNDLVKLMYGKEGIKTAELKIKYDKNLTGKEKREKLDKLWLSRNDAFLKYYQQANQALEKAKLEADKEKK